MSNPVYLAGFIFIALAAWQIGLTFGDVRLPLISGYLFAGIIAGPFVFNFITSEAVHELVFIDELSLAFIAFAAGSELYLKELRSRLKSIAWVTVCQILGTYVLGSAAVFLLAEYIPFMEDLPTSGRIAASVLVGSIMVARSPSSTIAIIKELHAKGPFTKTALGVTVVKDVVVIIFFAFNTSLADALLTHANPGIEFVLLLLFELLLSFVAGYVLAQIVRLVLSAHLHKHIKIILILAAGFSVFVLSPEVRLYTHDHFSYEILVEPLLIVMIAGFYITNFTPYRTEWAEIIHDAGPPIYVIFFALTGATLELDVLASLWSIALILFVVRLGGIFLGTFIGGTLAGDDMRYNRLGWMAYITQAGVGLGLAKEVAVEFPEFGTEFATLVISIIVIGQIVGPPFFKSAIRRVGEAHLPGEGKPDEIRDALILGIDSQSLALARQLQAHNWQVIMADTDQSHVERLAAEDVVEYHISDISETTLRDLLTSATDALVAMMGDDESNYCACALAYEMGIPRLIVRLNNLSWAERFAEFDALVVYPSSAMVHLLDQFVRVPQTADMLLHRDPEHEMVQITITDADVDGIFLRELRLPNDVLVLDIARDGHSVVPHGHTILRLNDEVTLVGSLPSLDEVTLRLGY